MIGPALGPAPDADEQTGACEQDTTGEQDHASHRSLDVAASARKHKNFAVGFAPDVAPINWCSTQLR